MNSIESLKLDFDSQVRQLNMIDNEKIFEECIYVGSGDSYVAGLIAEFLTNHKCRCYSPSDISNSRFLEDKTYCFISVTGRTRANIEIAKKATEAGMRTIAVTLDKNSKLAQVCNEIVPLKITKEYTATAGFSTFAANVVTSLQLAGLNVTKSFQTWYKKGKELSLTSIESVRIPKGTCYFLGNNLSYALALYSSFQMAEFFGCTVIAHKLEEFCHSSIFGAKRSHDLWILGQNEEQITTRLQKLGFHLSYFELYNSEIFAQLFESIFFIQNLILLLAKKYGYTELQYIKMKEALKASSDIIYAQ